jgi:two-component system CheB/CheR fusion protein
MITGNGDVHMAVRAMQAGAVDFIEKPASESELLASIDHALEQTRDSAKRAAWRDAAAARLAGLTARQRQILDLVLSGQPSKNIAVDLGISRRTVENHRAAIMHKTGSKSLPALVRLTLAAGGEPAPSDPKASPEPAPSGLGAQSRLPRCGLPQDADAASSARCIARARSASQNGF